MMHWRDIPPEATKDDTSLSRYLNRLTDGERRDLQAELTADSKAWEEHTYGGKIKLWHGAPYDLLDQIKASGFRLTKGRRTTFGLFGPDEVHVDNLAIFLADTRATAEVFGRNRDSHNQGGVVEVYADVKNVLDATGGKIGPLRRLAIREGFTPYTIPYCHQLLDLPHFVQAVQDAGYDAVRFLEDPKSLRDLGMNPKKAGTTLAVFDPKKLQIHRHYWEALGAPRAQDLLVYYARSKVKKGTTERLPSSSWPPPVPDGPLHNHPVYKWTSGLCPYFAVALHELTGFPLAVISPGWEGKRKWEDRDVWHVGCLVPGGFIDVLGVRSLAVVQGVFQEAARESAYAENRGREIYRGTYPMTRGQCRRSLLEEEKIAGIWPATLKQLGSAFESVGYGHDPVREQALVEEAKIMIRATPTRYLLGPSARGKGTTERLPVTTASEGYPFLPLATVQAHLPAMVAQGVSEVARSPRGFLPAYQAAKNQRGLSPAWIQKREAFIRRHMAQVQANGEPLFTSKGEPTRRHLALIAWAYSPFPDQVSE